MKEVFGYIGLAIILIPSALVCLDLFWFAHRCPKGGHHHWGPHRLGGAWVKCVKCGFEDY